MSTDSGPTTCSYQSPGPATWSTEHANCQTRGHSRARSRAAKSSDTYRATGILTTVMRFYPRSPAARAPRGVWRLASLAHPNRSCLAPRLLVSFLYVRELDDFGRGCGDGLFGQEPTPVDDAERTALGVEPVGHAGVLVRDHHAPRTVGFQRGVRAVAPHRALHV